MELAVQRFTPASPADERPVLLVHGFGSSGAADWVDTGVVAALTGTGRTVIVPDLPGHGASAAPEAGTGVGALATALAAAVTGEFDVVGYSMGARLAWELPVASGGRVRRAVLGGLAPGEPFATVDSAALREAVRGGAAPADPFTAAVAGMIGTREGLVTIVEALAATPFGPDADWHGAELPVFVVGDGDDMAKGIDVVATRLGATLVTVPGGHFEVLAGAGFADAVLASLTRPQPGHVSS